MRRLLLRESLDARPVGRVQAAQQLVQRAEHLGGELRRDLGLCLAAGAQQPGQPGLGSVGEEPRIVSRLVV
jgi:hypothetical protein